MATDAHNNLRTALYALGIVGTLGTWGRTALDGTLVKLFHALHGADDYILPGSTATLRSSFTGIYWPIDYLLQVLVIFFWEAVDGSHPATSAIGIYFLGQLFPILVAFYMTSLRVGGQGSGATSLIKPTLWLLSFQMCALGCTGSVWALSHIAVPFPAMSRPSSLKALQSASVVPAQILLLIFPALVLGYVLPAILMALPSPTVVTNDFQQVAVVIWNIYPVVVLVIFLILRAVITRGSDPRNGRSARSSLEHLRSVRLICTLSLILSSAVHIGTLAVSVSTVLFPGMFTAGYAMELHPSSLILPPLSIPQGSTVGDGVRGFFLWDQMAGYSIVILVMMVELRAVVLARDLPTNWVKSAGMTAAICCIAGPGSACLALSWLRDEILFGEDDAGRRGGKAKTRYVRVFKIEKLCVMECFFAHHLSISWGLFE